MDRRLKILKATLLLRRVNKYRSKEERISEYEKYYDDELLDREIEALKNPVTGAEIPIEDDYQEEVEDYYSPSCTAGDYSPSNPWNAPGMSVADFI